MKQIYRIRDATNPEIDLDLASNLWDLDLDLDLYAMFGFGFEFVVQVWAQVWIWPSLAQSPKDLVRFGVINNSLLYQRWGTIRKRFWHLEPNPNPNTNGLRPNPKIFFFLLPHPQYSRLLFVTSYLTKSFGIWANDDQIQTYAQTLTTNPNPNPNQIQI